MKEKELRTSVNKDQHITLVNQDRIDLYLDYVYPHYLHKDPAHDFRHIERIIGRLDILSEGIPSNQINQEHLYFLACFHELSSKIRNDRKFQDDTGKFLLRIGWKSTQINQINKSLLRHINAPSTYEEKIIHDANLLEVFGAFGIAKAFMTGGAKKQSFEETVEFYEIYINNIEFQTVAGKRLSKDRKEFSCMFLELLKQEW